MADYTKKNLKEIEDSAVQFGLAPNLEARFGRRALGTEKLGFSYQRYAPNFRSQFGHTHAEQEEVYVVLSGRGRLKLDDDILELKQWDAVRIPPGTMRACHAGPEGFELLAIGAPVFDETDAEMVQGWWSED